MASIVQLKVTRSTSAVASLDCTFDTTPTAGRLLVVFVWSSGGSPNIGVADNQSGNTYTQRDSDGYSAIWGKTYTAPVVGASGTFTITATPAAGSRFLTVAAFEIANWDSAVTYEKVGSTWVLNPPVTDYSPLGFTTCTDAEQLYLSGLCCQTAVGTRTISASTGWTLESQYTASDSLPIGIISKSVTDANSVAYDPEFDLSSGSIEALTLGISIPNGSDGSAGSSTKPAFYYAQL